MRFRAPARADVRAETFAHPAFAAFSDYLHLLRGEWPTQDALNAALGTCTHAVSGVPLRFVSQTPALLADGLHYETRIFETGAIATRAASWHDLFNALMWLARLELKCAVNAAYVRELALPKHEPRTRAQCALTHFDEGGAIVIVHDPVLRKLWDAHDWSGLFWRERSRWQNGAEFLLFGHALLEHLLVPGALPVAKSIAVAGTPNKPLLDHVREIVAGRALNDPQTLRPLPLAGIADWHPSNTQDKVLSRGGLLSATPAGASLSTVGNLTVGAPVARHATPRHATTTKAPPLLRAIVKNLGTTARDHAGGTAPPAPSQKRLITQMTKSATSPLAATHAHQPRQPCAHEQKSTG